MIDFTAQLSKEYLAKIEAKGVSPDAMAYDAIRIMRSIEARDIGEILYDEHAAIMGALLRGETHRLGEIVENAFREYCQRVAIRIIES